MRILSCDPSSSCTGVAVLETTPTLTLVVGERLRGKSTDEAADAIMAMERDLVGMLREHRPDVILIELLWGKQYSRKDGRSPCLAQCALAGGSLWCRARMWAAAIDDGKKMLAGFKGPPPPTRVIDIRNTVWTRGYSKEMRIRHVCMKFPAFQPKTDPGANVSDAIALCLFWLATPRQEGA